MIIENSADKIHHAIEKHLARGIPYIDALCDYAKENNIEVETVAEIVKKSPIMKEKIRAEATVLKLVKKEKDAARQFFD